MNIRNYIYNLENNAESIKLEIIIEIYNIS